MTRGQARRYRRKLRRNMRRAVTVTSGVSVIEYPGGTMTTWWPEREKPAKKSKRR